MRKKYYSRDIKAKLKPAAVPFNVYFRGANGQRAELLRQRHHVLLIQRKMKRKHSSKAANSKLSKRNSEKNAKTSHLAKGVKRLPARDAKRSQKARFFQSRKGNSAKTKIGGKFTFYEFKNEFNKMHVGSRLAKGGSKKTNQWGPAQENLKSAFDYIISFVECGW